MFLNQSQAYAVPIAGGTIVMTTEIQVINPAGTLATLTVTLPSNPGRGQDAIIMFTQIITALTLNGGTILGAITSAAANSFVRYNFNDDIGKWVRAG